MVSSSVWVCHQALSSSVYACLCAVLPGRFSTELEWMLSEKGVMKTDLEENPFKKRKIRDVMTASLKKHRDGEDSDDSDDWGPLVHINLVSSWRKWLRCCTFFIRARKCVTVRCVVVGCMRCDMKPGDVMSTNCRSSSCCYSRHCLLRHLKLNTVLPPLL